MLQVSAKMQYVNINNMPTKGFFLYYLQVSDCNFYKTNTIIDFVRGHVPMFTLKIQGKIE